MDTFDKIVAHSFKGALTLYAALFFLRKLFRPDVYRIVYVPIQYSLIIIVIIIGARWVMSKLRIAEGGIHTFSYRDALKILGVLCAFVIFISSLEYYIYNFPLTDQALHDLQTSQDGQNALGSPIKIGWFISYHFRLTGEDGEIVSSIPVSGSKAGGNLEVRGIRKEGVWHIADLYLIADHQKTIVQIPH